MLLSGCGGEHNGAPRDRTNAATPTAQDQSETPEDLAITKRIRQSVNADKGLSLSARNVTIVTAQGTVTLRGKTSSVSEKAEIGVRAREIAGIGNVDNLIEVPITP